ncbi:MAG: nuclear transport factor 2 family protein [bacterium]
MKNSIILLIFVIICFVFNACKTSNAPQSTEKYKQEILDTEKEFETCVQNEGITAAFYKFAATDAVLNHGETLIKGKEAIREYYLNRNVENNKLLWKAEFVDVSASGDLGYTYGNYIYTTIDSTGKPGEFKGLFHTVWKKQKNGSWKFVWD